MHRKITTRIDPAACLKTSRQTLNENFNSLYESCRDINTVITSIENTSNTILKDSNTTVKNINALLSADIYGCRLSLSRTQSDSNNNIESTSIFLHPYGHGNIALYNSTVSSWLVYPIVLTEFQLTNSNLTQLEPNTNYDIFLSYENKSFNLTFIEWNEQSNLQYKQGVCVLKNDITKRYLGCLRTTKKGTTEVKYTAINTHGERLKSFLWNYKNQTTQQISNILTVSYKNTELNTWQRTSVENEAISTENNCRLDFIVGDTSMLDFEYQNFFECNELATVNSGITIDSKEFLVSNYNTLCRSYSNTLKGWGTSTAQLNGNVPRGYHYLQTFDKSNSFVSYNIVYNNIYKTGFTGIIKN
jgi:hypothetical protein